MDLTRKITKTLTESLNVDFVRLEDDDGVSGFVVSPDFVGMSALERQRRIEEALNSKASDLSADERRRVLMVAGLTPVEYETVGASIRVHQIKEMAGGAVKILLHGGSSDAEFVRAALMEEGIQVSAPKQEPGAISVLMSLRARGTAKSPLTKDRVASILKQTRYVEMAAKA